MVIFVIIALITPATMISSTSPGISPLIPPPEPTPRTVLLSEDFSATWVPCGTGYDAPPGWTVDGICVLEQGPYLTHYWSQFNDAETGFPTSNTTPNAAGLWWSNGAGESHGSQQDEWLMTPSLDFTYYVNCSLSFNAIYTMPSYGAGPDEHNYIKASTDGGMSWDILGCMTHDAEFEILGQTAGYPEIGWCWYEMYVPPPLLPVDLSAYDGQPSVIIAWHVDYAGIGARGIHCIDDVHVDGTYVPPPPVDHIVVTPDPAFVTVGEAQLFTATAYDAFNVPIPGVTFIWDTDVGFVDASGLFLAQPTPATGYVSATNSTVTGTANVTVVAGAMDHITVTPNPVSIPVGGTQQFNATAYDLYNNIIPGVGFNWATSVGSVNATGFFTAQTTANVGLVTATNGSISGSANVNVVAGTIDHIIITPNPVTIMAGSTQMFTALAYDVYNNLIPGVIFNWTTNIWNETGGWILPPGDVGWINATNGTVYCNVTVNVIYGPIDYIIVTPDPAFVIVGGTQQFTATAYNVYNLAIPGIIFIWANNVGVINSTGFLTAFTFPMTGMVTATNGAISGSATVLVVEAIYNIDLTDGWNLISLPLEQYDENINQVLISINGKWDCVQAFDTVNDKWLSNIASRPDSLNDLHSLNHTMGFWINVNEPNVTLTVGGFIPFSTGINLYAGWNLISYPSLTNMTVADGLWGTGADKVEVFDPAEPYRIKEVGPSYVMKPGEGYWVHVPADTVWVVDW